MIRKQKWLQLLILCGIVAAGFLAIGGSLFSQEEKPPEKGDAMLDFTLDGLDGQANSLASYKGQPIVLNFWGTFCEPCVREMPLLERFHQEHVDEGLQVIGVNLNEPVVSVRSFVRETDVSFQILLDKDVVRKRYGVLYFPTTFFIDKDGTIQEILIGEMTEPMLLSALNKIGVKGQPGGST